MGTIVTVMLVMTMMKITYRVVSLTPPKSSKYKKVNLGEVRCI